MRWVTWRAISVRPYVGSEWTIEEAIPFWLICENDWRGWRDCRAAMEGTYDAEDWYGSRELEECLNAPRKVLEVGPDRYCPPRHRMSSHQGPMTRHQSNYAYTIIPSHQELPTVQFESIVSPYGEETAVSGEVMYLYRLDFVSNFNEFASLAYTAITQSSIDHRVMLRHDAPR